MQNALKIMSWVFIVLFGFTFLVGLFEGFEDMYTFIGLIAITTYSIMTLNYISNE